jgi:hypothetical protein
MNSYGYDDISKKNQKWCTFGSSAMSTQHQIQYIARQLINRAITIEAIINGTDGGQKAIDHFDHADADIVRSQVANAIAWNTDLTISLHQALTFQLHMQLFYHPQPSTLGEDNRMLEFAMYFDRIVEPLFMQHIPGYRPRADEWDDEPDSPCFSLVEYQLPLTSLYLQRILPGFLEPAQMNVTDVLY